MKDNPTNGPITEKILRYKKIKFFFTSANGIRTVKTHGSKMSEDIIMAIEDR